MTCLFINKVAGIIFLAFVFSCPVNGQVLEKNIYKNGIKSVSIKYSYNRKSNNQFRKDSTFQLFNLQGKLTETNDYFSKKDDAYVWSYRVYYDNLGRVWCHAGYKDSSMHDSTVYYYHNDTSATYFKSLKYYSKHQSTQVDYYPTSYNDNRHLLYVISSSGDTTSNLVAIYVHDSLGRTIQYDQRDDRLSRGYSTGKGAITIYDNKGRVIKRLEYDLENSDTILSSVKYFKYEESKIHTVMYSKRDNNTDSVKVVITLDSAGLESKIETYDNSGRVAFVWVKNYSDSLLVESIFCDGNGKQIEYQKYTYNELGDLVSCTYDSNKRRMNHKIDLNYVYY